MLNSGSLFHQTILGTFSFFFLFASTCFGNVAIIFKCLLLSLSSQMRTIPGF
ncbi:hypothetical protein Hanom_Chr16g01471641 [Helianthus anomalus]